MMLDSASIESAADPSAEVAQLRLRLAEAEAVLQSIRSGAVDAVMVGDQVYTLTGAQEPYRLLAEQMSEGALTLSHEGFILYANKNFARLLQLPLEHVIGAKLGAFIRPEGGPNFEQLMEQAERGISSGDVVLQCVDGSSVEVRLGLNALNLGKEVVISAVVTDITERSRRVQAKMRTLLRAIEQNPASIEITDRMGNIEYVNPRFEQVTGYTKAEVVGSNPRFLKSGKTPAETYVDLWKAISEGGEWRGELCNRSKSGALFWEFVAISAIKDENGQIDHYVAVKEDITERRQIEARLRESQKMEALGILAGGVAHDFNNALSIITGNVELARQDVGPEHPALESLEEIAKASRRSKDLVQQILAFSRQQTLERKPTALSMVVLESARLLRASIPAKVNIKVDCKPDTPVVLAAVTPIKQILLNLCSNAAHAVEGQERPGVIEVRLEACAVYEARGDLHPGRYACLTVRDNGSGMDEAVRSHLFEPFFTTKPVGQGTGLGLSVVHGIAQAHGASIEVDSTPGKGTTFRIYFPSVEAPVLDVLVPTPSTTPVQGKGKHILFVDDEQGLVLLMKRLLTRQGFLFSGYDDPREALEAVRADPDQFDLVVTDYNMTHLSGLELAQAVKAMRPGLPVILASGYITEELRAKAPAAGIRELIYKPNTADDLCEAVARYANAQTAGGGHRNLPDPIQFGQ
jgi:PAS domain S-box-containing protein